MTRTEPNWTGSTAAILLAAALLAIELGCAGLFARGLPIAGMSVHVAVCATFAFGSFRRVPVPTPATATIQTTALLIPFLGPLAALANLLILILIARHHDPALSAAHWHEHLFPNLAADDLTEQADAINRHQPNTDAAGEIESFYDVLRWGALSEKEHVLSLISRSFRPEFAPVLRAGLAVDDLGLRAQAAAGLSLLEARTSAKLGELRDQYCRTPGDAQRKAAVLLAQALADAAHSGLYDDARAEEMRREILDLLTPLLTGAVVDSSVSTMLGRTLIQLGDIETAVATLATAAGADVQGSAALPWLLEGVFRQGDYQRLGNLLVSHANQVRTLLRDDSPLAPALQFWGAEA